MVKKITEKRLENIALFYLQRYESSTLKLTNVLKRRVARAKMQQIEVDDNVSEWIKNIIEKMKYYGYIDDKRYAENQYRLLLNNGKSRQYIAQKLKQDGIDNQIIEELCFSQTSDNTDLDAAKKLVKKKKLGIYRPENLRQEMFKKDLSVLARAGFSYEISCQALREI